MFGFRRAGLLAGSTYKVGTVTFSANQFNNEYGGTPTITFSGGGGINAAATPVMNGPYAAAGVVTSIDNLNFTGYYSMASALPTIAISGGSGTGAAAGFQNGWGTGVFVGGTGVAEVSAATVSFSVQNGGGSGATVANQTGLAPRRAAVASIAMLSGGSGYTVAPTVVFTIRGDRTQVTLPTATANISAGQVVSITVNTGGEYIRPNDNAGRQGFTISLTGGNGTGATVNQAHGVTPLSYWAGPDAQNGIDGQIGFNVTNGGSGFTANPDLLVSNLVGNNSIVGIAGRRPWAGANVTNTGSGYLSAPTVTISGGTPALGTVSATATAGGSWYQFYRMASVTVTNQGSGYISAPNVNIVGGSPIVAASLIANMIPG